MSKEDAALAFLLKQDGKGIQESTCFSGITYYGLGYGRDN